MRERRTAGGFSRATLSAALAACLLTHSAIGAAPWLLFEKAAVKRGVRERIVRGIEEGDLMVLTFTLEEARALLRWEEPREFEYDGRMYDIVETQAIGETVTYKCWRDQEETLLNNRLQELASLELGEAADPEGDEKGPGSPHMDSHVAVVCDWRPPNAGRHRLGRLVRSLSPSGVIRPPTPPPRPA